jgi:hypothetical protein
MCRFSLVATVIAAESLGCSLVFVRAPPNSLPVDSAPLECTTSKVAPRADAVVGSALLVPAILGVYLGAASCDGTGESGSLCNAMRGPILGIGIGAAALSAVMLFSAYRGGANTDRCRELESQQPAIVPTATQ